MVPYIFNDLWSISSGTQRGWEWDQKMYWLSVFGMGEQSMLYPWCTVRYDGCKNKLYLVRTVYEQSIK